MYFSSWKYFSYFSLSFWSAKKDVFYSNMDIILKMRAFNVYVGSIFLYNSELWGLTQTQIDSIDAFHRRLLRTAVLNIKWPKKVSNIELYRRTGALPWSSAFDLGNCHGSATWHDWAILPRQKLHSRTFWNRSTDLKVDHQRRGSRQCRDSSKKWVWHGRKLRKLLWTGTHGGTLLHDVIYFT